MKKKKIGKIEEKSLLVMVKWPIYSKGHYLIGHSLHWRQKFFSLAIWTFWLIKGAEFYLYFKIFKLPYSRNSPEKVISDNIFPAKSPAILK
jgi:hypothetical protein